MHNKYDKMQHSFNDDSNARMRSSCEADFARAWRMLDSLSNPSSSISLLEMSIAADDLQRASVAAYKMGDEKYGRTLLLCAYQCYKLGLKIGGAGGTVDYNCSKVFSKIKKELGMDTKREGFEEPDFVIVDTRLLIQFIKIEARIPAIVVGRAFDREVQSSLEKLRRKNIDSE